MNKPQPIQLDDMENVGYLVVAWLGHEGHVQALRDGEFDNPYDALIWQYDFCLN